MLAAGKHPISRSANPGRTGGFTLIELILVMALLVIVVGVSMPSLSGFFHGRTLDSEAIRFLALTRYGQNRAQFEGIPMTLWVDTRLGSYGLEAEPSYLENDARALEFTMDKDIVIQVDQPINNAGTQNKKKQTSSEITEISFQPDGLIDIDSPETIVLRQGERGEIRIGQSRNRLNYEIQTNRTDTLRR